MAATTKKKPVAKADEKFDLAEWLADSDSFSHLDIDVFTSPKYTTWAGKKREFDALAKKLLGEDAEQDAGTLGEPGADQERLEELHDELAVLTPEVQATRKTIRFVDATTARDLRLIDAKYTDGDDYDEDLAFLEMLERFGLYEGQAKTMDEWDLVARRLGVWQWTLVRAKCRQYLGREGELSPDFSLPSLPDSLG